MKIVFGIGNPGKKYAGTRHNIGFRVVDLLAERHDVRLARRRFHSRVGGGIVAGEQVLLVRPSTYVNLCGEAAVALVNYYDCALDNFMVVCDDFNLALGTVRVRRFGGAGGHNGLLSIIEQLGSQDFPRLRIGIGSEPAEHDRDFVLAPFPPEEKETVEESIRTGADALEIWVESGVDACMNRYN